MLFYMVFSVICDNMNNCNFLNVARVVDDMSLSY